VTDPVIDVQVGELHAVACTSGNTMTLTLVGTADIVAQPSFNQLLGRLHNACEQANVRQVNVDLIQLEFLNSSCFKSFITWIVALRRLPEEQRYHIRFRANPDLDWQRSLQAISYFGGDLVSIEQV
jgi:hypothetical protein